MKEFDKTYILDALSNLNKKEKEFLYILLDKNSISLDNLILAGKKTIVKEVKEEDALGEINKLKDKLKELKLIQIQDMDFNPELTKGLINPSVSTGRKRTINAIRDYWKECLGVKRLPVDYSVKINFFLNHFNESEIRGVIFTACKRGKGHNPKYIYAVLKKIQSTVLEKKESLTPKIKINKEKGITQKQVKYIYYLLKANETTWDELGHPNSIENLNMEEAQIVIDTLGGGEHKKQIEKSKNSRQSKLFPDYV